MYWLRWLVISLLLLLRRILNILECKVPRDLLQLGLILNLTIVSTQLVNLAIHIFSLKRVIDSAGIN